MPKIVDRERQRANIVEAYLRIVARDGIEQATSRAVAAELGVSGGRLWYYFDDFDDVLFEAFRASFDRTNERVAKRTTDPGLPSLLRMLEQILPLNKTTRDEALVVVSLWGRVPSNAKLGAFQAQAEELWRGQIVGHLAAARSARQLSGSAPLDLLADLLIVVGIGQQVESVMRTPVARPSRQRELIQHILQPWLTKAGSVVVDRFVAVNES